MSLCDCDERNGSAINYLIQKILAKGSRSDMLKLERDLHETMPIGPEEGQSFYEDILKQAKGCQRPLLSHNLDTPR